METMAAMLKKMPAYWCAEDYVNMKVLADTGVVADFEEGSSLVLARFEKSKKRSISCLYAERVLHAQKAVWLHLKSGFQPGYGEIVSDARREGIAALEYERYYTYTDQSQGLIDFPAMRELLFWEEALASPLLDDKMPSSLKMKDTMGEVADVGRVVWLALKFSLLCSIQKNVILAIQHS